MATMLEIARLAGVSRGTVDRVMNGRGGVSPETTERILRAAAQLQYSPNKAARTLSAGKQQFTIDVILFHPDKNDYYRQVRQGALDAFKQAQVNGAALRFHYLEDWSTRQLLKQLDAAIAEGTSGIGVFAADDPEVIARIRQITQMGIPVVTMGTEIPECGQLGFVGGNAFGSGRTAAGLIHLIQRQDIRLGVILGGRSRFNQDSRMAGLTGELDRLSSAWTLSFLQNGNDDEFDCYDLVKEQMTLHPEVNTLFLSTDCIYGICRALERLQLPQHPKVVCYNNTTEVRRMLQKGYLCAAIGQEPVRQGQEAVMMLCEYLAFGTLPREKNVYTESKILIQENI